MGFTRNQCRCLCELGETNIAMNSLIESLSLIDCVEVDRNVSLSEELWSSFPFPVLSRITSGESELDATSRVYNQPIFKQNLSGHMHKIDVFSCRINVTHSPSALLSSRLASAGHQNLAINAAHATPAVTARARWDAI